MRASSSQSPHCAVVATRMGCGKQATAGGSDDEGG